MVMEKTIESLWSKLKALPWYGKLFLGVFILLAIVGLYAIMGLKKSGEISNSLILNHSKKKTDKQVANFRTRENVREEQRQELKKKRNKIRNRAEKNHDEYRNISEQINRADTPGELQRVLEELRERNKRRKRRR
jgi:hypothetical protein